MKKSFTHFRKSGTPCGFFITVFVTQLKYIYFYISIFLCQGDLTGDLSLSKWNQISVEDVVEGRFPRHCEGQDRQFLRLDGGWDFCTGMLFVPPPCAAGAEISS